MHRAPTRSFAKSATITALLLTCAAPPTIHADLAAVAPMPIQVQAQQQELIEDYLLPPDRSCRGRFPGETFSRTELFFSLSRPGGLVTEPEFQIFVDRFVTPRFPDGLTLLTGTGQFRNGNGVTVSAGSRILILLYPKRDSDANGKIEQIRTDYKGQFQQQSVLRADDIYCVSF